MADRRLGPAQGAGAAIRFNAPDVAAGATRSVADSDMPAITSSPIQIGRIAARAPEAPIAVVQPQLGGDEHLAEALIVLGRDEAHPGQRRRQGSEHDDRDPPAPAARRPTSISSIPPPNEMTSGTSGMPNFIAGLVAPL